MLGRYLESVGCNRPGKNRALNCTEGESSARTTCPALGASAASRGPSGSCFGSERSEDASLRAQRAGSFASAASRVLCEHSEPGNKTIRLYM
jgi:hypothetical protein